MNKREAAIVAAYTGYLIGDFGEMHQYIEEVLEGPVMTHEMGMKGFQDKLRAASKPDFIAITVEDTDPEKALHEITNMAHPLHPEIFKVAMEGLGLGDIANQMQEVKNEAT